MKRLCIVQVVLLATLVIRAGSAHAQQPVCSAASGPNQVCISPSAGATEFAGVLKTTPEQITNDILAQVDNLFQVANVASFLRDFQNAQAFSSKGLGVDYASEATWVEAGATLSLASNVDKAYKPSGSYTDPPVSGGGANFSLMGGLGFGVFGFDPLMVFANWFKGSASLGQLDGSYNNWGVHGQLRLFGPSRQSSAVKFLIRWGGIAITSGADYSRMTLSAKKAINSSFTLPAYQAGPQGSVSVQSSGSLTFTLEQTTWSIPLEVTTSLRLLSLVTVYGGFGMDFQLGGGSDLNIDMRDAKLAGRIPGTVGTTDLGTASITVKQHASPSSTRLRDIVGLQIGIFDVARLFVQVNSTLSSPMLASAAAGLRLGF
jgi:hypothetical protein